MLLKFGNTQENELNCSMCMKKEFTLYTISTLLHVIKFRTFFSKEHYVACNTWWPGICVT